MPAADVVAKLTAKGRITVPKSVCEHLGVKVGDAVMFTIEGERVTLKRVECLDAGFLKLATESFRDWNAAAAEKAFGDL